MSNTSTTSAWEKVMKLASAAVITSVASLSRAFLLLGCRSVTVRGLDRFLRILHSEARRKSQTGLLTYANHISVLDEPLLWGALPFTKSGTEKLIASARGGKGKSAASSSDEAQTQSSWRKRIARHRSPFATLDPAQNARWTLAASDIVYLNPALRAFFNTGQVLETHRGGTPFQPALDAAITQLDRARWVHIFPEGYVNVSRSSDLRRFKWGISRIAMEADRAPVCVPIWITGFDHVMPEPRAAPRWVPRTGAHVSVTFGRPVAQAAMRGIFNKESRCLGQVPAAQHAEGRDGGAEAARLQREGTYWNEAWEVDVDTLGEPEPWEIETGYTTAAGGEDVHRLAAAELATNPAGSSSRPDAQDDKDAAKSRFPPIPPHKPPPGGWPANPPDSRAARAAALERTEPRRGQIRSDFARLLREEMGKLGLCVRRAMGDKGGAGRLAHTIMEK
ncbi:hypothetical protein V8E36_003311 [Tilletia maclaganii]